jgi:hypothetical protein
MGDEIALCDSGSLRPALREAQEAWDLNFGFQAVRHARFLRRKQTYTGKRSENRGLQH